MRCASAVGLLTRLPLPTAWVATRRCRQSHAAALPSSAATHHRLSHAAAPFAAEMRHHLSHAAAAALEARRRLQSHVAGPAVAEMRRHQSRAAAVVVAGRHRRLNRAAAVAVGARHRCPSHGAASRAPHLALLLPSRCRSRCRSLAWPAQHHAQTCELHSIRSCRALLSTWQPLHERGASSRCGASSYRLQLALGGLRLLYVGNDWCDCSSTRKMMACASGNSHDMLMSIRCTGRWRQRQHAGSHRNMTHVHHPRPAPALQGRRSQTGPHRECARPLQRPLASFSSSSSVRRRQKCTLLGKPAGLR